MAITFLCSRHRRQICQDSEVAQASWSEWMKRGAGAFREAQWRQALSYLGCSYELAAWMLAATGQQSRREEVLQQVDRYMVSGHFLATCLARCGDTTRERYYLVEVHNRLLRETRSDCGCRPELCKNIEISLCLLERHFSAHGEQQLLDSYYREAVRVIQAARLASCQRP